MNTHLWFETPRNGDKLCTACGPRWVNDNVDYDWNGETYVQTSGFGDEYRPIHGDTCTQCRTTYNCERCVRIARAAAVSAPCDDCEVSL